MTLSTLSKTTPLVLVPGDIYLVTGEMFEKGFAFWDEFDQTLGTSEPIEGLSHKLKLVCTHPCGAMEFVVTGEELKTVEIEPLAQDKVSVTLPFTPSGNMCSCGGMLLRTGKCETCQSCGTTTGCG